MNNKGQVLILFLLLVPIILLGGAVLVDSSIILINKSKLDNINRDVLNSLDYYDKNRISELININDMNIVIGDITIEDNVIEISTHKKVSSVFGNIIGKDYYIVRSNIKTNISNVFSLSISDGGVSNDKYKLNNNILTIDKIDMNSKTLEFDFENVDSENLLKYGDFNLSIINNSLYLNKIKLSNINTKNLIDIEFNDKIYIYLNSNLIYSNTYIFSNNDLLLNNSSHINNINIYNNILSINEINNNYSKWSDDNGS